MKYIQGDESSTIDGLPAVAFEKKELHFFSDTYPQ